MTKKIFKQLITASYKNDNLDQEKVQRISKALKRSDLKKYIKMLKDYENKKMVTVSSPFPFKKEEEKLLKNMFPNKKIMYNTDKSLILGIKIIDNDMVYDLNLKNRLENLLSFIESN
ncbi:hypothetical protein C4559_00175 [Candidatus Microgenomates bacterium]|nr:MAG: hypothetical protein C4559_00175 [Candidatus Microgenomates bacterium]